MRHTSRLTMLAEVAGRPVAVSRTSYASSSRVSATRARARTSNPSASSSPVARSHSSSKRESLEARKSAPS